MQSTALYATAEENLAPTHPEGSATRTAAELDCALGSAIRLRRRALGISQGALGSACGISFQQVQKYENGANRVSFSRLVQIARALRCRLSDLVKPLDQIDIDPVELTYLHLLEIEGAIELLTGYAQLAPAARKHLTTLLASLEPPQSRGPGPAPTCISAGIS